LKHFIIISSVVIFFVTTLTILIELPLRRTLVLPFLFESVLRVNETQIKIIQQVNYGF